MIYSYNFQLVESQDLRIGPENRLFQYGDGLFETIILRNGVVSHLEAHIARLSYGAETMKINCSESYLLKLRASLQELVSHFNKPFGKIKIHLWRSEGGLFEPTSDSPSTLISIADYQQNPINKLDNFMFHHAEGLVNSKTSSFKSSSASEYVIAGLEKKLHGCDELIILNRDSYVAECLYSNIYWVNDNVLYTPSIESGCISGISRNFTLKFFESISFKIFEGLYHKTDLDKADTIFSTNVANIQILKSNTSSSAVIKHLEELHYQHYS